MLWVIQSEREREWESEKNTVDIDDWFSQSLEIIISLLNDYYRRIALLWFGLLYCDELLTGHLLH